jgi:hypothetical protein
MLCMLCMLCIFASANCRQPSFTLPGQWEASSLQVYKSTSLQAYKSSAQLLPRKSRHWQTRKILRSIVHRRVLPLNFQGHTFCSGRKQNSEARDAALCGKSPQTAWPSSIKAPGDPRLSRTPRLEPNLAFLVEEQPTHAAQRPAVLDPAVV